MKLRRGKNIYYEYKGKRYKVFLRGKMKIGQVWLNSIIYQPVDGNQVYIREEGDFFEKFTEVNLANI